MKIEKKKVIGNSRLSKATKAGVASLLGMSAVFMSGCLSESESDPIMGPPVNEPSSNSNAIEALSSSSVEKPSSSSRIPTSSSGGYHAFSSSREVPSSFSEEIASSSSEEVISSSSEEAVSSPSESSSSTFVEHVRSSSSIKEESRSSSSDTLIPPYPRMCETVDSTGIHVIMCQDDDRGMIASMVSTYEMFDNV